MITGHIVRQRLNLCDSHVVADTINYLEAKFFFKTDDWDGLDKWAHFAKDSAVYDIRLTGNCIRKEDHLNLSAGMWKVYLHGNEFVDGEVIQRITTDEAVLYVIPTGILSGEPFPTVPPSAGEQIIAAAVAAESGAKSAAEEAGRAAGSAKDAADLAAERAEVTEKLAKDAEQTVKDTLKEAMESGEFDGPKGDKGDPGDDYILTDEDKQEIAGRIPNGNVIVFVMGGSLERLRISAVIPPVGVSAEDSYTLIAKGLFDVIVQTYDSDDNSTGEGLLRGLVGDDAAMAVGEFWTADGAALVEMRLDFVGGTVEAEVRYTSGTSSGGGSGEPMSGATANDDGTGGTVPAPTAGQQDAVLHGDGTWREIEIPAKTSELANDSGFITKTAADLVNYYTKSQTYTQAEVNALVSAIPKFAISVVSALPTADISTTTVYLVKSGESGDLYTEYIYVGGAWEILGSQRVDLTGYATEIWVNTKLADYLPTAQLQLAINTALAQAKESGEFDGEPGISPTVSVSAITGGHRITITDKDGTKTVDVMDGADGSDGKDGSAGQDGKDGTSVTVSSVSESTEDGGSNIVTFSDGKTLIVKNGKTGAKGADGATTAQVIAALSKETWVFTLADGTTVEKVVPLI